MQITIVESFFTGSHRQWTLGYQKYSRHQINLLTLKGRYWKWRMFGGAVSLIEQLKKSKLQTDLFLVSDMVNS